MDNSELINWIRLARTPNIGPITFKKCIETFGSATKAIDALPELSQKSGRKKELIASRREDAEQEILALEKLNGRFLTWQDPEFPEHLKATEDCPPILSCLGDISKLHKLCLGIVGARNASHNATKLTTKLAVEVGSQGHIICSGLARGIDTAAHMGSLNTGTIAVLAGGVDVVYPKENQKLYDDIIDRDGLVISECVLGTQPTARHFPKRNRIVSGLSKAVLVVEATVRSGSLITARLALEQGRDVLAIPGYPSDPRAAGPNKLIRDGATLIRDAGDILEELDSMANFAKNIPVQESFKIGESAQADLDNIENTSDILLDKLSAEPVAVDELIRACALTASDVNAALLALELNEVVTRYPGNRVAKVA